MLNYSLTKDKDIYSLKNNDVLVPLNYTFYTSKCEVENTISSGVLAPKETIVIPITSDTIYYVEINATILVESVLTKVTQTIEIKSYLNLQESLIEDIFSVLCSCDCGCKNCEDLSIDSCKALLITKTKLDTYKKLVSPQYVASFDLVNKEVDCLITPQVYCDLNQEAVSGLFQYNEKLTKQLIALDYLAIYFTDLRTVTSEEDIEFLNNKYQADSILCCISTLGLDINKIKTTINNMASATIISTVYENLPPVDAGFLSVLVDNRTIDYPFTVTDFTENVTVYPPVLPNPNQANNLFHSIRIDSLLTGAPEGMLEYNNVNVQVGDIIPLANIGLLTYTSPNVDVQDTDTFTYSVSNVGAPTVFTS